MLRSGSVSRVLIIDMHPSFRYGLNTFLSSKCDFEILEGNSEKETTLMQISSLSPDAIVLNPMVGGIEQNKTLLSVAKASPQSKILATSDINDPLQIHIFLSEGASGYIHKESPLTEYANALRIILGGGTYLAASLKNEIFMRYTKLRYAKNIFGLTKREIGLLRHIVAGTSNKEIAGKLNISVRTVETHKRNIRLKCEGLEPLEIMNYLQR